MNTFNAISTDERRAFLKSTSRAAASEKMTLRDKLEEISVEKNTEVLAGRGGAFLTESAIDGASVKYENKSGGNWTARQLIDIAEAILDLMDEYEMETAAELLKLIQFAPAEPITRIRADFGGAR